MQQVGTASLEVLVAMECNVLNDNMCVELLIVEKQSSILTYQGPKALVSLVRGFK